MAKKKNHNKHTSKKQSAVRKKWPIGFYAFFSVLIIGLPFVYYREGLDPSIHPRLLFVAAFLILSMVYFFWSAKGKTLNTSILRNHLFVFLLAFILIGVISLLFSINPREGNYYLNKSFATLVLTAMAAVLMTNTEKWYEKLPIFFIVPAIFILGVGAIEYYDNVLFARTLRTPDNLPWIYEVRGNMAHKNQYSIALMLMLPFLGYGVVRRAVLPKWIYALVSALVLLAIIILKTRSVWVGLALSGIIVTLIILFSGDGLNIPKLWRRAVGIVILTGVLGVSSVFFLPQSENPDAFVNQINRFGITDNSNFLHRLKAWNITVEMIKDKPIQGVGTGNWKINSREYFKNTGFIKEQLNWLRPHNDFLWVLAENGILGLIAFIGIFISAFMYVRKVLRSDIIIEKKIFLLFIMAGLIGYLTVSFFTFPLERMNHQVYLGLFLATIVSLYHEKFGKQKMPTPVKPLSIFATLVLIYTIIYSISVLDMETKVKIARNYHRANQWDKLLEISVEIPSTFKTLDAEAMPIAWYNGLSNSKLGNIEAANQAYQEAARAHPYHVQVLNNLGRTYFQLQNYPEAEKAFLQALNVLPDYYESLVNLTSTYIQLKDYSNAKVYIDKIKRRNMNDKLLEMKRYIKKKLAEEKGGQNE